MKNQKLTYSLEEAKKRLERYCIYQDRCHNEVEQKLYEMRMIPEAKEIILLHLMEHNFLDEERFSKSFARGKFRIKNWGKQRIVRELKYRDISKYNIDIALKEIGEEEYINTFEAIALKKFESISDTNFNKKKQKLINYLLYKGYENYLVYDWVNKYLKNL